MEQERNKEELSPLEVIPDPQPQPEEFAEQLDMQCSLQKAMLALSPELRSIVLLHCSRELTFAEIGHILEMPASTVKTYFYRSLPRLRTALMAQEYMA